MSDLSPVRGSEMPTLMSPPGVVGLFDELPRPHEVATRARTVRASEALVTLRNVIRLLLHELCKKEKATLDARLPRTRPGPLPQIRTNVCANVTMACPPVKRSQK